jgi:hypothetical protein
MAVTFTCEPVTVILDASSDALRPPPVTVLFVMVKLSSAPKVVKLSSLLFSTVKLLPAFTLAETILSVMVMSPNCELIGAPFV